MKIIIRNQKMILLLMKYRWDDEDLKEEKKKPENDDELVDELIHQYRNGDVIKYIGDAIVILCRRIQT